MEHPPPLSTVHWSSNGNNFLRCGNHSQPATGDVTRGGGSILIIHNATIFGEPFEIWNAKLTRQREAIRHRRPATVHTVCWNVKFNLLHREHFDKSRKEQKKNREGWKNLSKICCQSSLLLLQWLSLGAIKNAHTLRCQPRRIARLFGGVVKSDRLTTRKLTAKNENRHHLTITTYFLFNI